MRSSVQVQPSSRGRTRAVEWDVARSKVRGQTDGDQLTFSGRGLSERSRLGNGSQLAIVRAYSRACSVLAMPGNNRRSSTAAENSPRVSVSQRPRSFVRAMYEPRGYAVACQGSRVSILLMG